MQNKDDVTERAADDSIRNNTTCNRTQFNQPSSDVISRAVQQLNKDGLTSFNAMHHEPDLWIGEFEKRIEKCAVSGMQKEVLSNFLDETSLNFYCQVTR